MSEVKTEVRQKTSMNKTSINQVTVRQKIKKSPGQKIREMRYLG